MSSGFISEKDLAEARQRRQEEWEKVRTEQQPLECPEEPYDGRSLYERLKEQKTKKDMEYEEAHKLKNLIRGLNDDEVDFLDLVDQSKLQAEKNQLKEEEEELKQFRDRQATLLEESANKKLQAELKQTKQKTVNASARPSQKALLGIGIKRKSEDGGATVAKKGKTVEPTTGTNSITEQANDSEEVPTKQLLTITTNEFDRGALKCIAILPGLGPYTESSDSEMSSGSDDEFDDHGKYDLVGRKVQKNVVCEGK